MLPRLGIQPRTVRQLDAVADPIEAFRFADVHVLHANGVAIRGLQVRHDVAQFRRAQPNLTACLEHCIQIPIAQTKMFQCQGGQVRPSCTYWVGLREQVTTGAVAMNQVDDFEFLEGRRGSCIFAVLGTAQIKPCKKKSPRAVHRLGVLQVAGVHGIERTGFGIAQKRKWVHEDVGVLRQ